MGKIAVSFLRAVSSTTPFSSNLLALFVASRLSSFDTYGFAGREQTASAFGALLPKGRKNGDRSAVGVAKASRNFLPDVLSSSKGLLSQEDQRRKYALAETATLARIHRVKRSCEAIAEFPTQGVVVRRLVFCSKGQEALFLKLPGKQLESTRETTRKSTTFEAPPGLWHNASAFLFFGLPVWQGFIRRNHKAQVNCPARFCVPFWCKPSLCFQPFWFPFRLTSPTYAFASGFLLVDQCYCGWTKSYTS